MMPASRSQLAPPEADEYAPFYAGYISLVPAGDPFGVLQRQVPVLRNVCAHLTEAQAHHRYAPEKWSFKEVLGHLADAERVLAYRLFRISRGDETPLSGFDENAFVEAAGADRRSVPALMEEFASVRAATMSLIAGISPHAWTNRGSANGSIVSARALVYMITGHVEHHLHLLRDRYGMEIPEGTRGER